MCVCVAFFHLLVFTELLSGWLDVVTPVATSDLGEEPIRTEPMGQWAHDPMDAWPAAFCRLVG